MTRKNYFPVVLLVIGFVASTALGQDQSSPIHEKSSTDTLLIGPIPGLTTQWHPAPGRTAIPVGDGELELRFRYKPPIDTHVAWKGARKIHRSRDGWITAKRRVAKPGTFEITAEYTRNGHVYRKHCVLEVVAIRPDQIEVRVTPSVRPMRLDEADINSSALYYYSKPIAKLRRISEDHYVTSIDRNVDLAVRTTPAGFEPLMEWDAPEGTVSIGRSRHVWPGYYYPRLQHVSVGPIANRREIVIERYTTRILYGDGDLDHIPTGTDVTLRAETDPPGYEDGVTWLAATKYGGSVPVTGEGPEFTVRFEDVWGPHPDTGEPWQWLGVKADDAVFSQDEKDPNDFSHLELSGPARLLIGESAHITARIDGHEINPSLIAWEAFPNGAAVIDSSGFVTITEDDSVAITAQTVQNGRPGRGMHSIKVSIPPPECSTQQAKAPDISTTIREIMIKVASRLNSLNEREKQEVMAALTSFEPDPDRNNAPTYLHAWDILDISVAGDRTWMEQIPFCQTKKSFTVIVDGTAYYAGSVNYVLFGMLYKLGGKTQDEMEVLINAYKGPIDIPIFGRVRGPAENHQQSLAWARAGFECWGTDQSIKTPSETIRGDSEITGVVSRRPFKAFVSTLGVIE